MEFMPCNIKKKYIKNTYTLTHAYVHAYLLHVHMQTHISKTIEHHYRKLLLRNYLFIHPLFLQSYRHLIKTIYNYDTMTAFITYKSINQTAVQHNYLLNKFWGGDMFQLLSVSHPQALQNFLS
jgi:hypothetical protein